MSNADSDKTKLEALFQQLFLLETVPTYDQIVALGKALFDARFNGKIERMFDWYYPVPSVPTSIARGMMYAAVRLHAGVNPAADEGCVKQNLNEIAQTKQWKAVRDELVKFSKRVFQELEACTPSLRTTSAQAGAGRGKGDDVDRGGAEGREAEGHGAGGTERLLTVTKAARIACCNSGVISKAADAGKLKSNGKAGRDRRIDAADLTRWILDRAERPEPVESKDAVQRKMDAAARKSGRSNR